MVLVVGIQTTMLMTTIFQRVVRRSKDVAVIFLRHTNAISSYSVIVYSYTTHAGARSQHENLCLRRILAHPSWRWPRSWTLRWAARLMSAKLYTSTVAKHIQEPKLGDEGRIWLGHLLAMQRVVQLQKSMSGELERTDRSPAIVFMLSGAIEEV